MARTRTRASKRPASVASAEGGGLATQSSSESAVADKSPQSPSAPATPASRTVYSQYEREEIHRQVCALVALGYSTVKACDEVGIARQVWAEWVASGRVDSDSYARAREAGADWHAEGIVDTAEKWALIDPQAGKLVVDAKKWVAARMYPKRWGEKLDVTSNGKEISPIAALPAVVLVQDKLAQAEQAEVLGIADLPRLPAE